MPSHPYSKIGLLAALLSSSVAHAATIVTENFSYANGVLTGNNGGSGWSGAWQTVTGQTGSNVNSGAYTTGGTFWNGRQFTTGFTGSSTAPLYFSADFTKTGADTAYALWAQIGTSIAGINPNGVAFGLANNQFSLRLRGGAETSVDFGSIVVGQTYTIVGKLEFNVSGANDQVTIWVNPTDVETATLVSSAATGRDIGWTTPSAVQVGSFVFDSPSAGTIDNFKIGDSWTAVAVPEPSAALLGGLGILALLRRRR